MRNPNSFFVFLVTKMHFNFIFNARWFELTLIRDDVNSFVSVDAVIDLLKYQGKIFVFVVFINRVVFNYIVAVVCRCVWLVSPAFWGSALQLQLLLFWIRHHKNLGRGPTSLSKHGLPTPQNRRRRGTGWKQIQKLWPNYSLLINQEVHGLQR